jgi:hypothetical protein
MTYFSYPILSLSSEVYLHAERNNRITPAASRKLEIRNLFIFKDLRLLSCLLSDKSVEIIKIMGLLIENNIR